MVVITALIKLSLLCQHVCHVLLVPSLFRLLPGPGVHSVITSTPVTTNGCC